MSDASSVTHWANQASEPGSAMTEQVRALWHSGRISPLRPLATPWLLGSGYLQSLASGVAVLNRAVNLLLRQWAAGAPDLSHLLLDPRLHAAARQDALSDRLLGLTRLDAVCQPAVDGQPLTDPTVRFLEIQAGDPSAIGWHDALAAAMSAHLQPRGEPMMLMPSHHRLFAPTNHHRAIAFVVKKDSMVASDHALMAEWYAKQGWEASVVDPSELRFTHGHLLAGDRPVEAVFRDAPDEFLAAPEGANALLEAHRTGAVVVMNSFASALADDKALLETLTTPERWDSETARVLMQHVPWTRRLLHRQVELDGRRVDLVEHVRRFRSGFVLKPADGYGGFMVAMGAFVDQPAWERALDDALSGPRRFVVQRSLPLPKLRVFGLDDAGPAVAGEQNVVHSFWTLEGRVVGAYVRASVNPVVNVHQGGGLTPVFFLSEQEEGRAHHKLQPQRWLK